MDKIAFLILAHKNPAQLGKLVTSLDDRRFDFFIHIDAKAKGSFEAPSLKYSERCVFLSKGERVRTYLNDFSLVDATLALAKAARRNGRYKYSVLLTGQDYPIKSNDAIYEKLLGSYPTCWIDSYGVDEAMEKGVSWVEHVGRRRFSQRIRRRLQEITGPKFYYSRLGRPVKILARVYDLILSRLTPAPRERVRKAGYTYSAGSHFWMLPDAAVEHLCNCHERDAMLNDIFRHTCAPEESWFQTALSTMEGREIPDPFGQFNTPETQMDNPALRLIKWYEDGVHTSGHPAVWNEEDYPFIARANALFARKFEHGSPIITLIDERLR